MKILHIDAFAGISGDMTVAALRDLGVPDEVFFNALSTLQIPLPECRFERSERGGIAGWRFRVTGHDVEEGAEAHHHHHVHSRDHHGHDHHHHDEDEDSSEHSHGHKHAHAHAHGRNHAEIVDLLQESSLNPEVKRRALAVFHRIAVAEGKIHGVPPEKIGFHEVGAEDSIADIVAACAGFVFLGAEKITSGPLAEGTGHIHCAHGTFPLPAPATLALLKGIPLRQVEEPWEHITPTGAALLAEFATEFGAMPELSVTAIGYGLGSRITPGSPNALRLILGTSTSTNSATHDEVVELRSNLDDLSPEHASAAQQALFEAGALDVTLTPTVMKKGRSGWVLEVLCEPSQVEFFSEVILRQTTAFGVRSHVLRRQKLERHHQNVETPYGLIAVKVGIHRGEVLQLSPEFSSCQEAANKHGAAVRLVHLAAQKAASDLYS